MSHKIDQNLNPTTREDIDVNKNEGKVQFKRQIGLISGTALVVGSIIGTGIFISPKGVYEYSNCSLLTSLSIWTLCGLFSILGALCYAEIGTTITRSGSNYVYIYEGFGPFIAYLVLWITNIVVQPTTQAIMGLTFSYYILSPFYPLGCKPPDLVVKPLSALTILLLTFINCSNVKWALKTQNIFTASKLLALIVIIVTGICLLFKGHSENLTSVSLDPLSHQTCQQNYVLAFYIGLFAYLGWNSLNGVTEELIDPYKNLPRATMMGVLTSTIVYVLANIAYFVVLTPTEVLYSSAIAVVFADKTLGLFAWVMPLFVGLSAFGSVNAMLFSSGRLVLVGAQQKQFPSILGMIHFQRSTPIPSLIMSCFITLLMLITTDIYKLINYFSFLYWLVTGVAVAAGIRLRFSRPEMYRPIKLPIVLSIIFCLSCLGLTAMAVFYETQNAFIGLLIVLVGIPLYFLQNKCNKSDNDFFSIRSSLQKLLQVVAIEDNKSENLDNSYDN